MPRKKSKRTRKPRSDKAASDASLAELLNGRSQIVVASLCSSDCGRDELESLGKFLRDYKSYGRDLIAQFDLSLDVHVECDVEEGRFTKEDADRVKRVEAVLIEALGKIGVKNVQRKSLQSWRKHL
jgi:hypothetical protein